MASVHSLNVMDVGQETSSRTGFFAALPMQPSGVHFMRKQSHGGRRTATSTATSTAASTATRIIRISPSCFDGVVERTERKTDTSDAALVGTQHDSIEWIGVDGKSHASHPSVLNGTGTNFSKTSSFDQHHGNGVIFSSSHPTTPIFLTQHHSRVAPRQKFSTEDDE